MSLTCLGELGLKGRFWAKSARKILALLAGRRLRRARGEIKSDPPGPHYL